MTVSLVLYSTWSEYQTKNNILSFILINTEILKEVTSSTMRKRYVLHPIDDYVFNSLQSFPRDFNAVSQHNEPECSSNNIDNETG